MNFEVEFLSFVWKLFWLLFHKRWVSFVINLFGLSLGYTRLAFGKGWVRLGWVRLGWVGIG
jgi:hypothetical protein